jgi:Protein of unknown function (DUF2478)
MKHVVGRMRGMRLAGVIQYRSRNLTHRCDMVLEDLTTGRRTSIFASRGRGTKGCQLDDHAMLQTVLEIELAVKPFMLKRNGTARKMFLLGTDGNLRYRG